MANAPYFLLELGLTAFRAYLQPKTFNFKQKRSLGIFGPNGKGKSSLVDGLEFIFSDDGSLERLGKRSAHNQAGPAALAHNDAEDAGLSPGVSAAFIQGKVVVPLATREAATKSKRLIPDSAKAVRAGFVVDPIVRGYSLRSFVEEQTPEQRYASVAGWLQLGALVEVQRNLRQLRSQVKEASEDRGEIDRIARQVAKSTEGKVSAWDDVAIVGHINSSVIAPLDKNLTLETLAAADPGYVELTARAKAEDGKLGLEGLRLLRKTAAAVRDKINDGDDEKEVGVLPAFERAVAALAAAIAVESAERANAKDAAFEKLWQAASPHFEDGATVPDVCPVCLTPLDKTTAGGAAAVAEHIKQHLGDLAAYAEAAKALRAARTAAANARQALVAALNSFLVLLRDDQVADRETGSTYRDAVKDWKAGDVPAAADIIKQLASLLAETDGKIEAIEKEQGEHTYAKAKAKVDGLVDLKGEHEQALRILAELVTLSSSLTDQASTVSTAIRAKVQSLLDRLRTPTKDIYTLIQGTGAATVRLELPPEDETNQQRLQLLIDFAPNRQGVQPSGYLSDSQIHSLALALRLAAILEFNKAAPIIILDDIVTSYDADHRRTFAKMLAEKFSACQLIIVTHDERFYAYLKELLSPADWHFSRIVNLVPAFGPRFADDVVSDGMIEQRWADSQSAANEMRQAEEEWLLARCREFGVSVRIRSVERPYSYERSELASALAGFLRDAKLAPKPVPGMQNRFLTTLEKGEVENFGSHFQDAQYGGGSTGDEKERWKEFTAFRSQFVCGKCGRTRFMRPIALKRPVCAHDSCQTSLEFASAGAAPPGGP